MTTSRACPVCKCADTRVFHRIERVPVSSCVNLDSPGEALKFPQRTMSLAWCPDCTFVFNSSFDETMVRYGSDYEETQSFSPTFRAFHESLCDELVARYGLRGGTVVEVGCGKGDFLDLLVRRGGNRGIGFDPAYDPERRPAVNPSDLTVFPERYAPGRVATPVDLVVCKMTLEHIPAPATFVREITHAPATAAPAPVFVMVPDGRRVVRSCAIEDIYYEHCSYFSERSLAALFERAGYRVDDVKAVYRGQYLAAHANPVPAGTRQDDDRDRSLQRIDAADIDRFRSRWLDTRRTWGELLDRYAPGVVLWGAGSKAVAFLAGIPGADSIRYVVDINPYRQGHFLPGSGKEIVGPERLKDDPPDLVVVMNPVYEEEVRATVSVLGVDVPIVPMSGSARSPSTADDPRAVPVRDE